MTHRHISKRRKPSNIRQHNSFKEMGETSTIVEVTPMYTIKDLYYHLVK